MLIARAVQFLKIFFWNRPRNCLVQEWVSKKTFSVKKFVKSLLGPLHSLVFDCAEIRSIWLFVLLVVYSVVRLKAFAVWRAKSKKQTETKNLVRFGWIQLHMHDVVNLPSTFDQIGWNSSHFLIDEKEWILGKIQLNKKHILWFWLYHEIWASPFCIISKESDAKMLANWKLKSGGGRDVDRRKTRFHGP